MNKKLSALILTVVVLLGMSSCSVQEKDTSSIESNLEQINKGIEHFSKLKNGTIEVVGSMKAKKRALKSMDSGNTENTSLTTFVLNQQGYDFIEEMKSLNKDTGEIQYTAIKQVKGILFMAQPIESSTKVRTKPYEWEDTGEANQTNYKPNGALRMMAVQAKLFRNGEYIKSITREMEGSLAKYTLITNNAYARHMKEDTHSVEENYILHEHYDVYWVNEDGLLIKHQTHEEFDYTIDDITDTYTLDITAELTDYNDKKLTEIK